GPWQGRAHHLPHVRRATPRSSPHRRRSPSSANRGRRRGFPNDGWSLGRVQPQGRLAVPVPPPRRDQRRRRSSVSSSTCVGSRAMQGRPRFARLFYQETAGIRMGSGPAPRIAWPLVPAAFSLGEERVYFSYWSDKSRQTVQCQSTPAAQEAIVWRTKFRGDYRAVLLPLVTRMLGWGRIAGG